MKTSSVANRSIMSFALAILVFLGSTTPAIALETADPSASAGRLGRSRAGRDSLALDLSDQARSITVDARVMASKSSAQITVGGVGKTVGIGSQLTAAELVALRQVLAGKDQTLIVDELGRAAGGSFNVRSLNTNRFSSLIIPEGVIAAATAGRTIRVSGLLSTNGTLVGLDGRNANTFNLRAGMVNVDPGGTITTQVSDALAAVVGASSAKVDLSIFSRTDIVNAGGITASGRLNLSAGGSIINALPAGVSGPAPVMSGAMGTTLVSGAGQFTNTGIISSHLGSVSFNTISAADLMLNNVGGQIIAGVNDAISFRNKSFNAKYLTSVLGGALAAEAINLYGGDGLVNAHVDRIDGTTNVWGGEAHIYASEGNLTMGKFQLTGDPTVANANGDVVLTSNLVFSGQDLAILARGNVIAGPKVKLIDLSNAAGTGGDLHIVAGFDFTPGTNGQVTDTSTNYTVVDPTGSFPGGSIQLRAVQINTSGSAGGGGITIVAHNGDTTAASIVVGNLNSTGGSGTGGSVQVIGQGGVEVAGSVTTNAATGGQVNIRGAEPVVNGLNVQFLNGTATGLFNAEDPTPGAGAAIVVTGNINTASVNTMSGGVGLSSDSPISVNGNITTAATGSGSGGNVLINSAPALSSVVVGGTINTSGGASNSATTAGTSGSVQIKAKNLIRVGGNIIARGGNNTSSGNAGNGNLVSLETGLNEFGPNPRSGNIGSVDIGGFIDARGGNATSGNGGNASLIAIAAGTLQVRGVEKSSGASIINSPGTGGSLGNPAPVQISTFGFQPFPANFDLTSTAATEFALPGGMFSVGNAEANGTTGSIINGLGIASPTDPVAQRIVSATSFGPGPSVTITPSYFSSDIVVDGVVGTVPFAADGGPGTPRTRVTPGQAVALFASSHSNDPVTTVQEVGINQAGQVISTNPLTTDPPSIIRAPDFEIFKPFTAFNLQTASGDGDVQLHISADPLGSLPTLVMPTKAPPIAGDIIFTGSANVIIDFRSQSFTIAEGSEILSDGALLLLGTGKTWTNNGTISAPAMAFLRPSGGPTFVNGPTGALPTQLGIFSPNKPVIFRNSGSSPINIQTIETIQFLVPVALLDPFRKSATSGFPSKLTLEYTSPAASPVSFEVVGEIQAGDITIKSLTNKTTGAAADLELDELKAIATKSLSVSSSGNLSFDEDVVLVGVAKVSVLASGDIELDETSEISSQKSLQVSSKSEDILINQGNHLSAGAKLSMSSPESISIGTENELNGGAGLTLSAAGLEIGDNNRLSAGGKALTLTSTAEIVIGNNNAFETSSKLTLSANSTVGSPNIVIGESDFLAFGGITITTKIGDIQLGNGASFSGQNGGARITTSSGNVTLGEDVSFASQFGGVSIKTQSGSVLLDDNATLAAQFGGVRITTQSGDVTLDNGVNLACQFDGMAIKTTSGSVTCGSGASVIVQSGGVAITTTDGSVTLGDGFELETEDGSVSISTKTGNVIVGSGSEIEAENGRAAITSQSGDVSLNDGVSFTGLSGGAAISTTSGDVLIGDAVSFSAQSGGATITSQTGVVTVGSGTIIQTVNGRAAITTTGGAITLVDVVTVQSQFGGAAVTTTGGDITIGDGVTVSSQLGGATITSQSGDVTVGDGLNFSSQDGGVTITSQSGDVTVGDGASISAQFGGAAITSQSGSVILGEGAMLFIQEGGINISAGPGQLLQIQDGASANILRGTINVRGGSIDIGGGMTLSAGQLLAGASGDNVINQADIAGSGSIAITATSGSINIASTDLSPVTLTSTGGNMSMTAIGGDIVFGQSGTYEARGGDIVVLASGEVTGGTSNSFTASAVVGAKVTGGGLEIGSGLTTSTQLAALRKAAPPLSPAPPLGTNVGIDNDRGRLLANISGGGQVNLSSSGANTATLNLSGGPMVFDAVGAAASVQFDGGSFTVNGLFLVGYPGSAALAPTSPSHLDEGIVAAVERSVTGQTMLSPRDAGVEIVSEVDSTYAFRTARQMDLHSGTVFLQSLQPTVIKATVGEVRASRAALFSVTAGQGWLSVRALSGPGHVRIRAGSRTIHVAPGREVLVANHSPGTDEVLPRDGVGRRDSQTFSVDGGLTVTTNDFSIVSMINSARHLAPLKLSASANHRKILNRLSKTAAAVELLSRSKGNYKARPVYDSPDNANGVYRTVAHQSGR